MKQLKKTLLTLVALLAVTTGAWATEFTSLKVGDVLHVGDAINTGTNYNVYGLYIDAGYQPATLVRANIGTNDITESETGAYYLIKSNNDFYYGIIWGDGLEGGYWPVTDNSDGISVTAITPGDYTELTFAVHEGTATPVDGFAWDKATKTGTFTMPGGNVTLEPEYFPQAALTAAPTAINDVPATTDGAIVKAGTVANIGSTETAQGTVMYYVSPTALDDAALLALAADQWTADVPTAEKLAQGKAYVYYYVRGNDSDTDEENFSDGDILSANALTVTIAAEPTYAVTFKAANTNTIEAGKATVTVGGTAATVTDGKLEGVKMGSEVKVKANTGYKFRKVEVKKGAPSLNITNPQVGQIIGSDGKNYAADATLPSGVTAVAMIAYVGSETDDTDYTGGLAIALSDEGRMNWSTAKSTCEGKTAVTGAKWCLPSQNQWKAMFKANGGSESSYTGLNTAISTAGGTALQKSCYWSSTEHGEVNAYYVYLFSGNAYFSNASKGIDYLVRAVLAF